MISTNEKDREALWAGQIEEFRDPAEVIAYWQDAGRIDPRLPEFEADEGWWSTLHELNITLLVTREYEHLLISMRMPGSSGPAMSMMRMPHPSGLAVDLHRGVVHVASTRNPNQIFDLMPLEGLIPRLDAQHIGVEERCLLPVRTRFLPGCLYIHDLAMINGELHANSVGQNAVVKLHDSGKYERVWWPKCVETEKGPVFGQNHLQLNSIAAGQSLETSFFSASTDEITSLRPGDPRFPVDARGVIFSGASREVVARGLTRPHSARFFGDRLWVDNSGYGQVGYIEDGKFHSIAGFPGWTRGLSFYGRTMFVGISRVLSRFSQYAPGLDVQSSRCGIYAVDTESGRLTGAITWPFGSQIFALEAVPTGFTTGFPFGCGKRSDQDHDKRIFYSFRVRDHQEA
jgi:uncharacterized protein (TIGR03032 family)